MTRTLFETNGNGGGNGHGGTRQWHEPVITDETEIRTFLEFIHAHAAKLATLLPNDMHPGYLQLSRISPEDGSTVPTRIRIGDVDGMVRDAVAPADAGCNVYIEGRTVSRNVHGKCRGEDKDTVFVFALVVDNDADKDRATSLEIEATLTVETSPGNSHQWLFFDCPVQWQDTKELGLRLRAAALACGCTGKISNPYRVPGTPNYPGPDKRARGRRTCSTSIVQRSGKLWLPNEMEEVFPPIPEHQTLDYGDIEDADVLLVAAALRAIPNNPPIKHQIDGDCPSWLGVLFACKWAYENAATPEIAAQIKALFDEWSDKAKNCKGAKRDPRNKQRDRIWKDAKSDAPNSKRGPIRIGTLFKYAIKCGWDTGLANADWCDDVGRQFDEIAEYWNAHPDELIAIMYPEEGESGWEPLNVQTGERDEIEAELDQLYRDHGTEETMTEAASVRIDQLEDKLCEGVDPDEYMSSRISELFPPTETRPNESPQQEEATHTRAEPDTRSPAGDEAKEEQKTKSNSGPNPETQQPRMTQADWDRMWGNYGHDDSSAPKSEPPKRRKTVKEFCAAYKPARRIVGTIVEAGYVYFLTAPAFGGKTQFATTLMHSVAANRSDLLGLEVRGGRVAYLALENPDDTRKRIMGQRYEHGLDHTALAPDITIIDEFSRRDIKNEPVSPLIGAGAELRQDIAGKGPLSVVFIDSFQAAFSGDDFNNNHDMLETVRLCRAFTQLTGNPAVIVLAHPFKNAGEDSLVPYGGNAAINECDGNLTLWRDNQTGVIKFHWLRKLRGTPFEPKFFIIKMIQCPDVLDSEGRQCEVPIMVPVAGSVEEDREEKRRQRQEKVLVELLDPTVTMTGIAEKLGIPKSSVQRTFQQLARLKLIKEVLRGWILTKDGKEEANRIKNEEAKVAYDVPF